MKHRQLETIALLAAIITMILVPGVACALPDGAVLIGTESHAISGAELATQALRGMNGVSLGSNGATVTLDVEGELHDIGIGLSDIAPDAVSGLGGIVLVAAVGVAIMRAAAAVVRVCR